MNIMFITEQGFSGKIPPEHTNLRTEIAWMKMLNALHISYEMLLQPNDNLKQILAKTDLAIMIPSKKQPEYLKAGFMLKGMGVKLGIMQEGACDLWQDWDLEYQMLYLALIKEKTDIVFCHNEYDKNYYQAITKKPIIILSSTQEVEPWVKKRICPRQKEESVFIGGNMCRWYGGFQSYLIVSPNKKITTISFPSMGRKQKNEEQLMLNLDERIQYFGYLDWTAFMEVLNEYKYAVHLMPESAAGSFSLNCGILGVPCIGNKNNDTQCKIFPDLSIDVTDLTKAKELMKRLIDDQDFYDMVVTKALQNVKQFDMNYQRDSITKQIEGVLNG